MRMQINRVNADTGGFTHGGAIVGHGPAISLAGRLLIRRGLDKSVDSVMSCRLDFVDREGGQRAQANQHHGRRRHLAVPGENARGRIQIDPLITHTMPLARINEAFDLMHAGESIRSVVTY